MDTQLYYKKWQSQVFGTISSPKTVDQLLLVRAYTQLHYKVA